MGAGGEGSGEGASREAGKGGDGSELRRGDVRRGERGVGWWRLGTGGGERSERRYSELRWGLRMGLVLYGRGTLPDGFSYQNRVP